ncbi:Peptidoglycan-binding lysin domain [Ophiocordyceps camponoti-floridani]|uniref:Peptidoglycan-binding lysin domain n=1 Tax=Ophiocordyceps camponoti-floridani TaxID=2030778 RepID=A0A8H4Q8X8_9HYPO|nr:Peptidoglycan-binding lysin domain [Ophiocordyceps camponoti-floridani]
MSGSPVSQISEAVKDGGKRIQIAGMQFPRKDSMVSSGAGLRRQSFPSGSRTTRHRDTTSRTGVTRVPGEPMGPAKKRPCCNRWSILPKRSLDCVPCDDDDWQHLPDQTERGSEDVINFINEDGVKNPGGKDARASSTFEDRKGGVSQDLKGAATQDLASIGSKELVNSSPTSLAGSASEQVVGQSLDQEMVDAAAESLAGIVSDEGVDMAAADGAAMVSDGLATSEEVASHTAAELASIASEELEDLTTVAASENLATAIAEGLPVDLSGDAMKPPRTDKLAWRRLGVANKQLLYYKPGRDVRKIPVTGLKTAIILKALLLAGPSGREGLRELVPAFKDFDNLVGEVQEYLFGAQQSDIDGNKTKALLIQWFKHLAEATQPALTYQPSPYQRSYRERMDAAWQYNHPVLSNYDKCLRIWQDPHPNHAYQSYLETINCDPLYKLSMPESPHDGDDVEKGMPKLTPRERCQRVKENPHSSKWYQSVLLLAHCGEPEAEDVHHYPTELTPGDKCHAIRRDPHPRKEYQAQLLAWHCNSDFMNEDDVITSLPAGALTQPGTPSDLDCEKWIMIKNKQDCETLADMAVTDRENIVRWNSADDEACPRLWIGRYACIEAK